MLPRELSLSKKRLEMIYALTARLTFTTTTAIPRFAAPEGEAAIRERLEAAANTRAARP